jgi:putative inorganic carbon (hco3(-)) transporter
MHRISPLATLQFFVFAAFVVLISISPSLNIIPNNLIVTSFHDSQRLIELLLVGMVLVFNIIFNQSKTAFAFNNTMRYGLYTLIALAVISSYLAESPRHALIEISLFAGLSYLTLLVVHLYNENKALLIKPLIYALWAGILLYMVSFYVGYTTATIFNTAKPWPALLTGFSSIRSFNQYQLWGLGLITLPLLTFDFKNTYTRRWLHVALIFWWVILFYSTSRGALLAWGLGLLCTALIYRKLAWPFIRLQFIHITAGYLGYVILFQFIPSLRHATAGTATETALVTGTILRNTTSDRIGLWNLSFNLIQDHPIFGVGAMHYAWNNTGVAHPHNSALQLMAEWGLPAALIIITIAGYGFYCWLKKVNINSLKTQTKLDSNLGIILFFTMVTNAAYSLVDGVIVMPISQVMMFTVIGLVMGYYFNGRLTETKQTNKIWPVFAGIILITLVWSTLPEILQGAAGSEKHFSIGYTATGPRLWLEVK